MSGVKQVGGTHYEAAYQHWDMVVDNEVGYLEANATKYISRWRKKAGKEDIKKAISYVEKILEIYLQKQYRNSSRFSRNESYTGATLSRTSFQRWVREAKLDEIDASLCLRILSWDDGEDLRSVHAALCALLAGLVAGGQATPRATTGEAPYGRPTVGQGTEHHAPFGYNAAEEVNPLRLKTEDGYNG